MAMQQTHSRFDKNNLLQRFQTTFDRVDFGVTRWMATHGITIMRVSLGVVFIWFGALKIVPGLSPAEGLIRDSLSPYVPIDVFMPILIVWELAIGLGFLTGRYMRVTILLLLLHMPGTASPIVLLPDKVFTAFPYGLTLEGQYIVKNLTLASAALVIGATVRGGQLVNDPVLVRKHEEVSEV